jgi:polyphosphate glucokinase
MQTAATLPKLADLPTEPTTPAALPAPSRILVVDIGGTKMKVLASGETEPRKAPSGKKLTPGKMVETVRDLARDWEYDAVSIGYPGLVGVQGPRSEPGNLGHGWVGFDYAAAFERPVRIVNDAAMQALGSYEGGRMLFLGLGTGLGSTLVDGQAVEPLELGHLPYRKATFEDYVGQAGRERLGKKRWREAVAETIELLSKALEPDYVVLGGGNAKLLKELPPNARLGANQNAFIGAFRLWDEAMPSP